jgi:putative ABC transport system ATP-binding protein
MIQAKNLAKRYASKRAVQALQGVSLDVARGEMVAIMGPSGCGKSTFLNIIGGLDRPTEGSILVDGIDLNRLDDGASEAQEDRIHIPVFQPSFHAHGLG